MIARRRGLARTVLAIVMAAVVAVAAVGVYLGATTGNQKTASPASTSSFSVSGISSSVSNQTDTTFYPTPPANLTTCAGSIPGEAGSGTQGDDYEIAQLFGSFSQMSVTFGGSFGSALTKSNESYSVIYAAKDGPLMKYRVSISSPPLFSGTAWVLSNGTVLAYDTGYGNETGPLAQGYLDDALTAFTLDLTYSESFASFFPPSQVHPGGQTQVMLGPTAMNVTSYEPDFSPAYIYGCYDTTEYSIFQLQAGVVPGTHLSLVTFAYLAQTDYTNYSTQSQQSTTYLQILSITSA